MDEAKEQQEATQRFEAAIAALEPFLVQAEDGQLSLDNVEAGELGVDPDDLQNLVDSVSDVNAAVSEGLVALNDVRVTTPGIARG